MNATPPPTVVVQQKQGPGCWGIGCAIVLIVLLLLGGLCAGISWYLKSKVGTYISSAPATIQTFDGGDQMYRATQQKLADFGRSVQQNQPATLKLSADEINTLFARDPDLQASHVRAFVAMTGNQAHVEASLPGSLSPLPSLKDSYFNGTADLSPTYDPSNKSISLNLRTLTIGTNPVPTQELSTMETELQFFISMQMQQSPNVAAFLDHLQSAEVRDGKLVLQTQ